LRLPTNITFAASILTQRIITSILKRLVEIVIARNSASGRIAM